MRVLVVLNESPLGSHPDVYEAFDSLTGEGLIDGFDVVPFLARTQRGTSDAEIEREILQTVRDGGHGVIVWMHTGRLRIRDTALRSLKKLPASPVMVYWEMDAYHPFYKPVPREALAIMRCCKSVYMVCGGPVLGTFRRAGISDVQYAPSPASGARFPVTWKPEGDFLYDVVMIGNRVASRIPFKRMPGAVTRARLVHSFQNRFGSRFAVFGTGWMGPSAQGPCRFEDQGAAYARANVAIGVDNLHLPYYFSNRLPIALACGVPIAYHANPGFDQVFSDDMSGSFFDDVEDAASRVAALLAIDPEQMRAASARNRRYVEANLSMIAVARYVVRRAIGADRGLSSASGRPSWQAIQLQGGR